MRKWLRWINVFLKFCRATDIFIFSLPIATQIQRLIIFAIIYAKDVGALLRLSRIWALALPRTRISNSIAHAEIYWDCRNRMDRVQYTQSGRFSCVSSSAWICEIQMLKITFVNVLFTNKIWPLTLLGYSSRCKYTNYFWMLYHFELSFLQKSCIFLHLSLKPIDFDAFIAIYTHGAPCNIINGLWESKQKAIIIKKR